MPADLNFAFVVEGEGEVEAFPLLVRRICHETFQFFSISTSRPVRCPRSTLLKPNELERAVEFARGQKQGRGPVLVLLDADDDCPAQLGPQLKARVFSNADSAVEIIVSKREYEAWFLAAAVSLAGMCELPRDLASPNQPEQIRGAKEWLRDRMPEGRTYSPTVDQAKLTAAMDLTSARSAPSFDRLCRIIQRIIESR